MLAPERQRLILAHCRTNGSVEVRDLARQFGVTDETIRRDLKTLEARGELARTHGGAVIALNGARELPFSIREVANYDKKRAIAQLAVRHIEPEDVIALDGSSTACELAKLIPDMPLTVVTNAVPTAAVLGQRSRIRVLSCGGLLDPVSLSYVGSLAERTLGQFQCNKVFLSPQAVDLEWGLSVTADVHARMKRRMMELSDQKFLLADSTKFGRRALESFAHLGEFDWIFTDAGLAPAMLAALETTGRKLAVAALPRARETLPQPGWRSGRGRARHADRSAPDRGVR